MSCLPKPVLRGHVVKYGIKHLLIGLGLASINSASYYYLVAVPRKKAEIEFYKTYDPEAHYKEMVAGGYIQFEKNAKKEKQFALMMSTAVMVDETLVKSIKVGKKY